MRRREYRPTLKDVIYTYYDDLHFTRSILSIDCALLVNRDDPYYECIDTTRILKMHTQSPIQAIDRLHCSLAYYYYYTVECRGPKSLPTRSVCGQIHSPTLYHYENMCKYNNNIADKI